MMALLLLMWLNTNLDIIYLSNMFLDLNLLSWGLFINCTINYSDISCNSIFKYAIKVYSDPLNNRDLIYKDNKNQTGVYAWINNTNGKFFIGSGDPLYVRLSDYYQDWFLSTRIRLYIVRAIVKYGLNEFTLVIL